MPNPQKHLPSKLTLLRHAKSSWTDSGATDHDRTLNARGRRDAPEMARRLAERGLAFDHILCSTAQRTRETADLMLPILGADRDNLQFESRIYEASISDLLSVVTSGFAGSVLLIGHNPGLEGLCEMLCPGCVPGMPTCAVASFEVGTSGTATGESIDASVNLAFYDFPKNL
ncbi:MAG: histidine phosphatase family protein [Granulosicoccus sp.]|nr:histidine phosphatase family protein [Granulosicoccus sp.]